MAGDDYISPLVILAPEKSRGSAVCRMLGRHPEMCALVDTRLFARNEMYEWMEAFDTGRSSGGLVRCVAEVVFGGHSKRAIKKARRWLQKRINRSTIDVFTELAAILYPLLIVERTAMLTYRSQHMCRVRRHYPEAKFLHVVLHPAESARLLIEYFEECLRKRPKRTLKAVIDPESMFFDLVDVGAEELAPQPYRPWYRGHKEIVKFLESVPKERQMMVRAEDLLAKPESHLKPIVEWLGVRSDAKALDRMAPEQHSDHSRTDRKLQPAWEWPCAPPPEVAELAQRLGYAD